MAQPTIQTVAAAALGMMAQNERGASQEFHFGAVRETFVHPAVACAMVLAAVAIFFLPRRYVAVPLLAAAFLIPVDQRLVVAGLNFIMMRILILFAWIRILPATFLSRDKLLSGGMNAIDKATCFYTISSVVTFTLLWRQQAAFINHMASLYTILGVYLALRFFIRDEEDAGRAIRALAYIAAVVAVVMIIEQATGRSPYDLVGRSQASSAVMERGDRFRAMGPFMHPILAGTFGATLLPVFGALWLKRRKYRGTLILGLAAGATIMIASVSSTPLMACIAGFVALCFWPLRNWMRLVRWSFVGLLISLHMVMKAPVWALIGRTDLIGGSSGYHRQMLVDQFIRKFWDWFLLGTKDNAQWGWDMWDTANQYVAIGQDSGILPLIGFVAAIVYAFKYLGKARKACEGNRNQEMFFWALGAALFSHVVGFFGIYYFDQTMISWYALLAMISAVAVPLLQPVGEAQTKPAFADAVPASSTAPDWTRKGGQVNGAIR